VQLRGGTLQVHSEPSVGSQFSFTLEFGCSEPNRNATPELAHQNVLIVEDNEAARMVLLEAARSLGWKVDAVESGEQALALYRRTPQPQYDVLVVDWRMPGINGLQTIAQLVHSLHGRKVPTVVMVTLYDRDELMADPLSRYADVVATKPLTASALFNVVLDAKAHHGLLTQHQQMDVPGQRLAGIRVMLVDDSEINRDVAMDILMSEGAVVDVACDGAEALIRLSSGPAQYELVLMDVQMPVMDGYEATRQIRMHPLLKHLPVIALTAGALKNQQDTALQRGMDAFVPKPFEVEQLLDTIVRLVRARVPGVAVGEPVGAAAAVGVAAWDALPLIDLDAAQRKWRRPETLVRHLKTFVREHCDDAAHMLTYLHDGQMQELTAVAHKLRGAAGALSLQRCLALATAIEESVLANPAAEHVGPWIVDLQRVLQSTARDIETHLKTQKDALSAGPQPASLTTSYGTDAQNAQALRELLEQLRTAVRTDDPAMVERHIPAVAQLLPSADVQILQILLDTFDFTGVSRWIAAIELESETETEIGTLT
jgi:CheY-like chemotaxis protein